MPSPPSFFSCFPGGYRKLFRSLLLVLPLNRFNRFPILSKFIFAAISWDLRKESVFEEKEVDPVIFPRPATSPSVDKLYYFHFSSLPCTGNERELSFSNREKPGFPFGLRFSLESHQLFPEIAPPDKLTRILPRLAFPKTPHEKTAKVKTRFSPPPLPAYPLPPGAANKSSTFVLFVIVPLIAEAIIASGESYNPRKFSGSFIFFLN